MGKLQIPENYTPVIDYMESQRAIKKIKDFFQQELAYGLQLRRVSAPLFVAPETGLNDNLNGVERTVSFTVKDMGEKKVEIVQSLAKWKRMALGKYNFKPGTGLYTDMNAIRRDEELDNLHSIYVDQWDWEQTIADTDRNLDYLKATVEKIYDAIRRTEQIVYEHFPHITPRLPDEITFIHSEELLQRYPDLSPKERENAATRECGAVFLIGIGAPLSNGEPHDGRAPDYDDWSSLNSDGFRGLNGDILVWDNILGRAVELSSMGIRVSPESLDRQLAATGCSDRAELLFHSRLLCGELPPSIGGGIGQSRLCMFLLQKAHVGEVQASIWPEEQRRQCEEAGIMLL